MFSSRSLVSMLVLLLVVLGLGLEVQAQGVVVVDSLTKEPIPYITLKKVNSSIGFVADQNGVITLSEPPSDLDQYTLSCIGYQTYRLSGQELKSTDSVFISTSMLELDEVVVLPLKPEEYINQAMQKINENYLIDSSHARAYYMEGLEENGRFLNRNEAWIDINQPGYLAKNDTFIIDLEAGRHLEEEELRFMAKEQEKSERKERKQAKKKGEPLDEANQEIDWEGVDPLLMLRLDPIRHPEVPMHINNHNVNFLDSNSHDQYNFWYGKPQSYNNTSLVVIHFEPKKRAKAPIFTGTLWIEQASMAFVKISFGFSDKAQKHMIPGYAKALLWAIGLRYDIRETLVEFIYQPFEDRWSLSSTYLKALLDLEKRRFFSENDQSSFTYEGELIMRSIDKNVRPLKHTPFDPNESLSDQIQALDPNPWEKYKDERRTILR